MLCELARAVDPDIVGIADDADGPTRDDLLDKRVATHCAGPSNRIESEAQHRSRVCRTLANQNALLDARPF